MIEVRCAKPSDMQEVCGKNAPLTFKGYAVTVDDKAVCVAGIILSGNIIFSDFKHEGKIPKRTIWRYAKILLEKIREFEIDAVTTPTQGRSKFLESIGMKLAYRRDNQYFYKV